MCWDVVIYYLASKKIEFKNPTYWATCWVTCGVLLVIGAANVGRPPSTF